MIILVSGSTKTVRSLAVKRGAHLGHLLTPATGNSMLATLSTGLPWAADNGAYSGFVPEEFDKFLAKISNQPRCLFVVAPDVVANAKATISFFSEWEEKMKATNLPVAFVIQDGQEDLEMPHADAYFIGGSTEFKLSEAAATCAEEGHWRNAWIHMGRVNSHRRMKIAHEMFVDSVDGTATARFGEVYIDKFCRWAKQLDHHTPLF